MADYQEEDLFDDLYVLVRTSGHVLGAALESSLTMTQLRRRAGIQADTSSGTQGRTRSKSRAAERPAARDDTGCCAVMARACDRW